MGLPRATHAAGHARIAACGKAPSSLSMSRWKRRRRYSPSPKCRAFPGRGLEGDRYFTGTGFYSQKSSYGGGEVTLIEIEALEALFGGVFNAEGERFGIKLTAADTRRNIATSGVPLNHCRAALTIFTPYDAQASKRWNSGLSRREFRSGSFVIHSLRQPERTTLLRQFSASWVRCSTA